MENCIVKDKVYKIGNADDKSVVLVEGSSNTDVKYKMHRLVSNNVDFYWGQTADSGMTSSGVCYKYNDVNLLISCKGSEIVKYENPSLQVVIDYLNKYENLSIEQIEELVIEAQSDSKTKLQEEIETLQEEKKKLLEQIAILKQIEEKKDELKLLLSKLND